MKRGKRGHRVSLAERKGRGKRENQSSQLLFISAWSRSRGGTRGKGVFMSSEQRQSKKRGEDRRLPSSLQGKRKKRCMMATE